MGQNYWLKRQRSALGMARLADTADSRLIHYDLAGRYSIRAAESAAGLPLDERSAAPLPARIGQASAAAAREIAR